MTYNEIADRFLAEMAIRDISELVTEDPDIILEATCTKCGAASTMPNQRFCTTCGAGMQPKPSQDVRGGDAASILAILAKSNDPGVLARSILQTLRKTGKIQAPASQAEPSGPVAPEKPFDGTKTIRPPAPPEVSTRENPIYKGPEGGYPKQTHKAVRPNPDVGPGDPGYGVAPEYNPKTMSYDKTIEIDPAEVRAELHKSKFADKEEELQAGFDKFLQNVSPERATAIHRALQRMSPEEAKEKKMALASAAK